MAAGVVRELARHSFDLFSPLASDTGVGNFQGSDPSVQSARRAAFAIAYVKRRHNVKYRLALTSPASSDIIQASTNDLE